MNDPPAIHDAENNEQSAVSAKRVLPSSPELVSRKAIKSEAATSRPKAAHWDPEVQEVLQAAILYYRYFLSVHYAFPDISEEVDMSQTAWWGGCRM